MEKVFAGVCGETQFGKDDENGLPFGSPAHQVYSPGRIESGVGNPYLRYGHGETHEVMTVKVEERRFRSLCSMSLLASYPADPDPHICSLSRGKRAPADASFEDRPG